MSSSFRGGSAKRSSDGAPLASASAPSAKRPKQDREIISISSDSSDSDPEEEGPGSSEEETFRVHPGEIEVIDDEWPDHDERCHGPIDTKANRRDYPHGFEWTCCGGDLTTEGCEESSQAQAESEESSVFDETGHTGELEIVEEEWPDHDERCHGPIDTKANRRDFPDGFEWSCCGGNAAAPSCDGDGDQDEW